MSNTSASDPFVISPDQAPELARELLTVWKAMFDGAEPGELAKDLERMASWYGPQARPASIAKKLGDLRPVTIRQRTLSVFSPPLILVSREHAFLTPEGRVALEDLLASSPDEAVTLRVQDSRALSELYRRWSHAAVLGAVRLQAGEATQTRPPALAFAVLLLVLGSVGQTNALVLNTAMSDAKDQALRDAIGAFTRAVSSSRGCLSEPIWGYPASEALKRFAALRRGPGEERAQRFWIEDGRLESTANEIAIELTRKAKIHNASAALSAADLLHRTFTERREELGTDVLVPDDATNGDAAAEALRQACADAARR
jgi:hypothetical protein